ncbi:hypothetical protein D3C85_1687440 [compost metagenome]
MIEIAIEAHKANRSGVERTLQSLVAVNECQCHVFWSSRERPGRVGVAYNVEWIDIIF